MLFFCSLSFVNALSCVYFEGKSNSCCHAAATALEYVYLSDDDLEYFQGLGCLHGRSYCLQCDVVTVPGTLRRTAPGGCAGVVIDCFREHTKMPNIHTENVCILGCSASHSDEFENIFIKP